MLKSSSQESRLQVDTAIYLLGRFLKTENLFTVFVSEEFWYLAQFQNYTANECYQKVLKLLS